MGWTNKTSMSDDAGSVRGLIEARVSDAPALLAPGREAMSYSRLLAQVDSTLGALHAMGIGRGDRVATVLANGPGELRGAGGGTRLSSEGSQRAGAGARFRRLRRRACRLRVRRRHYPSGLART